MKKQLAIAGVAAAIGLSGIGAGVAHAATNSSTNTDPMSSLVDKIATKFNLNKSDVQQVFDQQRTEMQAQQDQKVKDDLAQLVKDGKLTQAQSDAITAKRAELEKTREANRTTMQSMSDTDRKAAMDKQKSELEAWANQQGIDTQYLRYVMGHGPGGHGGPGHPPDDGATSSTTPSTSN